MKPALIVFDIDGTLFQTDRVTVPAVQRTFATYGLTEPDAESICSFFGRPVEEYLQWIEALCPPGLAQEVVDATNQRELDLIGEEGALYPGILETIQTLHAEGHAIAICSNGPEDYVDEFLDAYAIRPFCRMIRARGTKYSGKEAMLGEILDQIPLRPAIVIGDRADDIHAAHVHGALAIAAGYGFGSKTEYEKADVLIYSAHEILNTIHTLLVRKNVLGEITDSSIPNQEEKPS